MTFNDLHKIVYALTLADRPGARKNWIDRGFKIASRRPGFLLKYWQTRLQKNNPQDIEMYFDVLAKYYKASLGVGNSYRLAFAAARWIKSGLRVAADATIEARRAACNACEFWDHSALRGTGKCKVCGCSTWAKIRMATESCPNGKWGAEE